MLNTRQNRLALNKFLQFVSIRQKSAAMATAHTMQPHNTCLKAGRSRHLVHEEGLSFNSEEIAVVCEGIRQSRNVLTAIGALRGGITKVRLHCIQ
ncbi:hypothetical protein CA54_00640 [Symmachiella macrocystis]|uniref:Uncharacterized protein n=1 Tax=Symmachiella macrocystis TaxID=2527985 RepID=A0A5C6BJA3_9PLAN|nr:hypothetical protein [Symmachiella macrocystis]TWU11259.1 hypothetical protein CA54_00640 [Symmachiella macrocystis]